MAPGLHVVALVTVACPVAAWDYGLMIDAGSGGTRLHAYRWPMRVADPLVPQQAAVTTPQEVSHVDMKPGITAFARDIPGLENYIKTLLAKAEAALQSLRERWHIIPIYLKATAGARDLYQDQRDELFAKIRELLYACNFRFESHYWARTISGEEEGAYAWLTANAIKGTYRVQHSSRSWGSLDMGGSSTQIAFVPHDTSIIQNYYELHLSHYEMHLYSHSYLEFGYRDANQRLVRAMLRNRSKVAHASEEPLVHPCFPNGTRFIQYLREPFVHGVVEVPMIGGGNFDDCLELAIGLLNLDARCYVPGNSRDFVGDDSTGACAIAGMYEPKLHGRNFFAMGQYAKVAEYLGLPSDRPVAMAEFLRAARQLFDSSPHAVEFVAELDDPEGLNFHEHASRMDTMGLPLSRCWKAVWSFAVLHHGLRFPFEEPLIHFASTIDGQDAGWTLGAMMHEVNYFPWKDTSFDISPILADYSAVATTPLGLWHVIGIAIAGAFVGLLFGVNLGARWSKLAAESLEHQGGPYMHLADA